MQTVRPQGTKVRRASKLPHRVGIGLGLLTGLATMAPEHLQAAALPFRAHLLAVAGTSTSGVAAGEENILFSNSIHQTWFGSLGEDSTVTYTAALWTGQSYLVAAEDGTVWRSSLSDGSAFFEQAQATGLAPRGLAVVGSQVVLVGDGGTILKSQDLTGGSWVPVASPVTSTLRAVAWNGTSTVAVGDDGVILRGGSAGTNWEEVDVGESRDFSALVVNSFNQYLAVGEGGMMWKAEPDGLTWTALSSPTTTHLRGTTQIGLATVMVGDSGTIYYSAGGFADWQPAVSPTTDGLRAVTFTGSDAIAVGENGITLWSALGTQWEITVVPIEKATWGRVKRLFLEKG